MLSHFQHFRKSLTLVAVLNWVSGRSGCCQAAGSLVNFWYLTAAVPIDLAKWVVEVWVIWVTSSNRSWCVPQLSCQVDPPRAPGHRQNGSFGAPAGLLFNWLKAVALLVWRGLGEGHLGKSSVTCQAERVCALQQSCQVHSRLVDETLGFLLKCRYGSWEGST